MNNTNLIKIADAVAEIPFDNNGVAAVEVEGKTYCMALHNEILYACNNKCPHASAALSQGYVDAIGNIVCPLHRYKFSLKNGRNVSGEGYYLKTFVVVVNEDGVFIEKEKKKGFLNF
jgi:nitrite reductase/ring-hydroxylating ferredoxin subunit